MLLAHAVVSLAATDYQISYPAGMFSATGINNLGQILGYTQDEHRVLRNPDGSMVELGDWTPSPPNDRVNCLTRNPRAVGDISMPDRLNVALKLDLARGALHQ